MGAKARARGWKEAATDERRDNLELVDDLEGDGVEVGEGRVDDVVLNRVEHGGDADLIRERGELGAELVPLHQVCEAHMVRHRVGRRP